MWVGANQAPVPPAGTFIPTVAAGVGPAAPSSQTYSPPVARVSDAFFISFPVEFVPSFSKGNGPEGTDFFELHAWICLFTNVKFGWMGNVGGWETVLQSLPES